MWPVLGNTTSPDVGMVRFNQGTGGVAVNRTRPGSVMYSAIARLEVAAGEGALRTAVTSDDL